MRDLNTRILVIDDEEVVRDTFCEILKPRDNFQDGMNTAAAALFDEPTPPLHSHKNLLTYEVQTAANGKAGFALVQEAIKNNAPFSMIFCDMRMPGWDGLTTVQHIRSIDKNVEIVFVTAYSDHSADEITRAAGPHVGYHCKPFEADEIRQIATKGVCDWNKLRDLERLIELTADLNVSSDNLNTLLQNVLHQITEITDNRTALLIVHKQDPTVLLCVGDKRTESEIILKQLYEQNKISSEQETESYLYLPMSDYGVLLLKDVNNSVIDESKTYLIRLFIQQAAKAIDNANLQQELAASKRLSDLGEAASCLVHDLKQPLTVITGAIQLCNKNVAKPERLNRFHQMIENACEDLGEFINDILEFSNNKDANKSAVIPKQCLTEIATEYEIIDTGSIVQFKLDNAPETSIQIDERQVIRAIKNIINNALDALSTNNINTPCVTVSATQTETTVDITITDNGPGIPDSIKDTLFTPFVTKNKSDGTGLGMAISKKIVDINNGTLSFDTSKSGTTFNISFPY